MSKSSTEQGTSRPPSPPHNIAAWPAHWARQRPGALAVGDESRGLDWGAFEARIAALAGRLRVAGVGVGDRVAVLLTNRTAFLEILFGTTRVGAIFLPINLRLSAREIAFQLDDSQPDAFFYESELQETVEKTIRHALHSPTHLWPVGGEPDSYEEGLN
ncbi:MAG: class I adenylate-forming enzyme family protein, partial [Myxococcota bacterium]